MEAFLTVDGRLYHLVMYIIYLCGIKFQIMIENMCSSFLIFPSCCDFEYLGNSTGGMIFECFSGLAVGS